MKGLGQELRKYLNPWFSSLENPSEAQIKLLKKLINVYKGTRYGEEHDVKEVGSIEDFREKFPVVKYNDLKPYLKKVYEGEYNAILNEPPVIFMMTRGTTGKSKIIPVTKSELDLKMEISGRALLNHVYRTKTFEVLEGYDLNLNFPSKIGKISIKGKRYSCGFSSGIYAMYSAERRKIKLVPEQQEIDKLGPNLTRKGWEKRFELVYEKAKEKKVTMLIGVVQVMIEFAKYLKRKHKLYPKNVWRHLKVINASSAPNIQTIYKERLQAFYGKVSVVETYAATEGVFAQQLDAKPFVSPNYDCYIFEVETRKEVKMLYEMKKGEIGKLIVSSLLFPRYDIGDLVRCERGKYFVVIGRANKKTLITHYLNQFLNYFTLRKE